MDDDILKGVPFERSKDNIEALVRNRDKHIGRLVTYGDDLIGVELSKASIYFLIQHHVWLELTNQKKHNIEIALLVPESDRTFNRLASSENLLWVGHKAIATPMIMVKEEHGQPHQSQQHLNMVDLVAHHMDRKGPPSLHDPKDEYQEASGSEGEGFEESKDWIFRDEEDSPVTLMVKLSSSLLPALCRAGESIDPVPRSSLSQDLISSIANYEEIASMYDQHQCSSSVIKKLKANLEVEEGDHRGV
ncbi:hypothetical protein L484_014714 [Morus notabilis]|uniref:Uncharacterized protein n=1 Tax=Morus notabilis TaxID=981085 RepID=W9QET4_9ROSA|nr:hypothetical protein L484_014714 [Morus notabilis]